MHERQGEPQTLALPLRQPVGPPCPQLNEVKPHDGLVDRLPPLAPGYERQRGPMLEMSLDAHPCVQATIAGREEPDLAVVATPAVGGRDPVDSDCAAVGGEHAGDDPEQRRLPAPLRPLM